MPPSPSSTALSVPSTGIDARAVGGLPIVPVDAVALEGRASMLAGRSIKKEAKRAALLLITRCIDLTTLEGADTTGRIENLCRRAVRPDPSDPEVPSVAAVCVYPERVPDAVGFLRGTGVAVASVAGAFPSGLAPLDLRLEEMRRVVAAGAGEVDIVINRAAFLSGRYHEVFEEIAAAKEACGAAHLKVILETGELGSYDQVRRASTLAMAAGADVIKTSTGKINPAATLPVVLCMAEAIRDYVDRTGTPVGLKVAGGVRTAKQAWQHLVVVNETLGAAWLNPERFRLGASALLTDVLLQLRMQRSGRYEDPDDLPVD
jgi:deoxyribose-phosphate aldolase